MASNDKELKKVLIRLATDRSFLERLMKDRNEALKNYNLTQDQIDSLDQIDLQELLDMDPDSALEKSGEIISLSYKIKAEINKK